MNKNLLKGLNNTGANTTGATNTGADLLAFEAFFSGEVAIWTKLEAGAHTGTVIKIEDVIKETLSYTKLTIKLADRETGYAIFNKDIFLLEYNLMHNTQFTTLAELNNQSITMHVAYTGEDDNKGTRSIIPVLPEGTHQVTFKGFTLFHKVLAAVITFEVNGQVYHDIRQFTPEKTKGLQFTFSYLAKSLGFNKPVPYATLNDKIGAEIPVTMVRVDGYKKLFLNYSQPQSTLLETDNSSDTDIPEYNY